MTTRRSFPRTLAHCLGHNLLAVLVLATVLIGGMATQDKGQLDAAPTPGAPTTVLAERSDCWTTPDDAPAFVAKRDPGTVVVSGGASTDPQVIRQAMEQWYVGAEHGLRVYGFCRR